ncbi:MAG TPA: hypothetical protein VD926_11770, partial [Acidimicrobiales bacterium]|nr:hypothetical protein [Acidimicrobiales bacterium]
PTTTGGDPDRTIEGSGPPGGTVDCETAPTLTPPNGPPGTEVTASAAFTGNCDDSPAFFFETMTCFGQVSGGGLEEPINFPVDVIVTGESQLSVSGTFTAPAVEPDPPVVDAIEQLSVTITCNVAEQTQMGPGEGIPAGTTYVYPAQTYALELFADPDSEQPTLVEDDDEAVDPTGPGVVAGSPTFTG